VAKSLYLSPKRNNRVRRQSSSNKDDKGNTYTNTNPISERSSDSIANCNEINGVDEREEDVDDNEISNNNTVTRTRSNSGSTPVISTPNRKNK